MKLTNINKLEPGQVIGQPLYDDREHILIKKGTPLTQYMIKRVEDMNYSYVYVYAEDNDYEVSDVIRPELRQKAVNSLRKLSSNLSSDNVSTGGPKASKQTVAQMNMVRASVADVVDELFTQKNVVVEMIDVKQMNSALYQHSVNTMIHATILGTAAGLDRNSLEKLAMGALFHDIGHLMTPPEILKKKTPLTEKEKLVAQAHTTKGFAFLTDQFDMPPTIKIVALEHHEKYDGTGYPQGKGGEDLHLFSRITAIANKFDSLTSERPYRRPESLSECVEYIMGGGGSHFDPKLTKIYIQHINPYPVNTLVKLNDGKVATVVETNRQFFMRPKVKIIRGNEKGTIIDLMHSLNTVIETDLTMS